MFKMMTSDNKMTSLSQRVPFIFLKLKWCVEGDTHKHFPDADENLMDLENRQVFFCCCFFLVFILEA